MDTITVISIHSLFLAQILGLYLVLTTIIMVCRRRLYQNLLADIVRPNLTTAVWGIMVLMIGIILVALHNIWVATPQVLVTLVAWYILIKGILWLSIPEKMLTITHQMNTTSWFYVHCAVAGILGIILLAKGYYLYLDPSYIPLKMGA